MVALAAAVVVVVAVVAVVVVVAVGAVAAEVETEGVGGKGIGSMLVVVVMSRFVWSPLALSRRILGGFVTVSVAAAVVVVEEEVSVAAGVGVVGLGLVGLSGSLDWVICLGGGDVALSGLDPALLSGLTGRLASLDNLFTTGFSS